MGKKLSALLDPRGIQERNVITLSKRPSLEELKKGRILFFNNTKLDFCNYGVVFTRIKERLREMGFSEENFVDEYWTVRGKDAYMLEAEAARMIEEHHPIAAITAFGDMGTSSSTTVLSIALEKQGVPTVYMTAPPGTEITRGVATYRAGHLCMCSVDVMQFTSKESVAAQIDEHWDYIIGALTENGKKLQELAEIPFGMDKVAPREDGLLPRTFEIDESDDDPAPALEEINDYFNELHISDGLPIVPPTEERYKKMMEYCPFDEDMKLTSPTGPAGRCLTVKDVAVSAIMAGCKPQAMPILIAAWKALNQKEYNLNQSVTTSHPGGNLVLVSGPIAQEIGLSGKQGCQGPGYPVNAAIGRAVNLAVMNVFRSVPGVCDLDCIASQAEFTYCFAEEPELAEWSMINEDRYDKDTTTVYVLKAEPLHDIIDFLSMEAGDLLDSITACCTTLGSNNAYMPGPLIVCLTPDHAMLLKQGGYTKRMIQEHIHQYSFHQVPMVRDRGLKPVRPASWKNRHPLPVTRTPEDVEVVTIGGRGGHSGVILPWALHSEGCVEPVALPDGQIAKSIEEFKR